MKKKYVALLSVLAFSVLISGCNSQTIDNEKDSKPSLEISKEARELTKEIVEKETGVDLFYMSEDDEKGISWVDSMNSQSIEHFEIESTSGEFLRTDEIIDKTKPTVIYFFATWCSACENASLPISEFVKENKEDMNFIMVSGADEIKEIKEYEERWKLEKGEDKAIPMYKTNERILNTYEIFGFPSLIFIDKNQDIYTLTNAGHPEILEKILEKLK